MTKLTRFFGTCVLVVSLFGVALAGDILTPPVAPPPPAECSSDCPATEAAAPAQPAPDSSVYVAEAAEMFAEWLVASIL